MRTYRNANEPLHCRFRLLIVPKLNDYPEMVREIRSRVSLKTLKMEKRVHELKNSHTDELISICRVEKV